MMKKFPKKYIFDFSKNYFILKIIKSNFKKFNLKEIHFWPVQMDSRWLKFWNPEFKDLKCIFSEFSASKIIFSHLCKPIQLNSYTTQHIRIKTTVLTFSILLKILINFSLEITSHPEILQLNQAFTKQRQSDLHSNPH